MTQESSLSNKSPLVAADRMRIVDESGNSKTALMSEVTEFTGEKTLQYTKITNVSADYTLLATDQILMVDTTAAEVVITLPLSSSFSSGVWRNFIINHTKGTNNVKIICSGTETFVYGNTWFDLGSHPYSFTIGTFNNGVSSSWGLVRNVTVKASVRRDTNWSAANFSSITAIPFDVEAYNSQDELMITDIGGANTSRLEVLNTGTYKVSYGLDIDSTGGFTWNLTAQLYKNGVAVSHTDVRTGNYGGEDSSLSFIPSYIDLVAGDYLELRINQNNLTGNLVGATLNLEIRL